jgi:putative aldouronate transport system substrate-binding protein
MKKVLSIFVAVMLIAAMISGCGSSSNPPADSSAASSASSETSAAASSEASAMPTEPIEFTAYMGSGSTDSWDTPVAKKITELTGVSLKIENSVGDGKQRISLMAASGELPDIIYASTNINLLIDVDGIEKLDDLIEQYGPNIKKLYGDQYKKLRWNKEKPNIYCLGDAAVNDEQGDPSGFELQHAVVKELGYPKIKTVADFENAIKTYYAKHPTFKGPDGKEQPTIPLLLNGYDWGYYISIGNPANWATGSTDDEWAIDPTTLEAKRHIIKDSNKEYFRWMNGMWNQGLIDKESFTEPVEQYKAKLSSGRVLAIIDAAWNFQYDVHPALRAAGMEDRMYGRFPATLDESYICPEYQYKGYMGYGSGMAITTKCKDKVRAVQFLDWMCTEEAQILADWGIEGTHWNYDANGKRAFLPDVLKQKNEDKEFSKHTGIGAYVWPWPRFGTAYRDKAGNPVSSGTIENWTSNYTAIENEVLAGYGVKTWKELFPQKDQLPVAPFTGAYKIEGSLGSDFAALNNKLTDLSKKYCPRVIMAKPGEFDKVWDNFVKDMEAAGVREAEAQFTKAVQERVELWK